MICSVLQREFNLKINVLTNELRFLLCLPHPLGYIIMQRGEIHLRRDKTQYEIWNDNT